MKQTLTDFRPALITEFWPYGLRAADSSPEAFLQFLRELSYSVFLLDESGLRATPFDQVLDFVPPLNPLRPDDSYLNLVFLPAGSVFLPASSAAIQ
jgi:hypothetical protein